MTSNPTRLFINRLVVSKSGHNAYDENFHKGINVIRGEHSVGKTTILDLIFYALGGEIKSDQWLYPANTCDEVYCEIDINYKVFCLKREIDPSRVSPTYIHSGSFNDSQNDSSGWVKYGPRRNDNKYSFSQQLFELLGWEHHKTDEYANLTMHQIMRLLYLDQQTSLIKIFRHESQQHDSELMRTAISEFMLGLDNLDSHKARQDLLRAERKFYKARNELDAIFKVLGKDSAYRSADLQREIATLHDDISKLNEKKIEILTSHDHDDNSSEVSEQSNALSSEIDQLAILITNLKSSTSDTSNEIADCTEFSKSIDFRKKSLLESKTAYENFGFVEFKYCPSCQTKLDNHVDNNKCPLCKSDKPTSHLSDSYLEILTELQFQEKQNVITITSLEKNLSLISTELITKTKELEAKRQSLRQLMNFTSDREELLTKIAKEIGFIESQIETLLEKTEIIEQVDSLRETKELLVKEMSSLEEKIKSLEAKSIARRTRVLKSISECCQYILEQDLDYELTFKNASKYEVEIDFPKDRWLLDGRSRFSDSSNVIKKSALHLACLIHSLNDVECRYPRFLIMDFEGGGIKPERSKNLQKIITSLLNESGEDFQLIISTAMVDDSLNNETYGVGPYYVKGDYALRLS